MRRTRVFFAAALALLLVGCVDKTKVIRTAPAAQTTAPATGATTPDTTTPGTATSAPAAVTLSANVARYVALPENGRFGNRHYKTSGEITANALAAAFGRHLTPIQTGKRVETLAEGLASAKDSGATYLIFPQILE